MSTSQQDSIAAGIALELAGAPASGNLKGSYSSIVNESYDKLADNDKALFLFLRAIECYLDDGEAGQIIAQQMAKVVTSRWEERAPATRTISPITEENDRMLRRIHGK